MRLLDNYDGCLKDYEGYTPWISDLLKLSILCASGSKAELTASLAMGGPKKMQCRAASTAAIL